MRKNLKVLQKAKGNGGLKAELSRKPAKLEDALGRLSGELVRLSEENAELRGRMTVLIRSIALAKGDQ